jgi:putative oxidoreductase
LMDILSGGGWATWMFSQVIMLVQLGGGILLMIGLITRIAAIFQIPILLGAVIINGNKLFSAFNGGEFVLSLIILLALIFFAFFGSGIWSADAALERESRSIEDHYAKQH